jgi:hypothetical protein
MSDRMRCDAGDLTPHPFRLNPGSASGADVVGSGFCQFDMEGWDRIGEHLWGADIFREYCPWQSHAERWCIEAV